MPLYTNAILFDSSCNVDPAIAGSGFAYVDSTTASIAFNNDGTLMNYKTDHDRLHYIVVDSASNQGNDGIGIYYQKSGTELQFKNINTLSNALTLTDNTNQRTIDATIVESNLFLSHFGDVDVSSSKDKDVLSFDKTSSRWINRPIARNKSGSISPTSFTGNPKKYSVVFQDSFTDTSYSISISGTDSRAWSWESKTVSGFTINTNANQNLTGNVDWLAIQNGEF